MDGWMDGLDGLIGWMDGWMDLTVSGEEEKAFGYNASSQEGRKLVAI